MNLIDVTPTTEQTDRPIKGLVAACGFETRARFVLEQSEWSGQRVAIRFLEGRSHHDWKKNERAFRSRDFQLVDASAEDGGPVRDATLRAISEMSLDEVLTVDISSMTRVWLAGVISALQRAKRSRAMTVVFAYCPGTFQKATARAMQNDRLGPLSGFVGLGMPHSPLGLVLGLGYEPERATGLVSVLDPQITLLCVARSEGDDRYYPEVLRANKSLLASTRAERRIDYTIQESVATYLRLESLANGLLRSHRVVMASLGPKIFGLHCFLVAARHPGVGVWRVSASTAVRRNVLPDAAGVTYLTTRWE